MTDLELYLQALELALMNGYTHDEATHYAQYQ